ncbi:hypothetical protein [Aquimarina sp. AU119]|uniref:hypothetical protein n=1 Tax=Aquimarina sp. AU119 TaxID=2108528 RepID=UPI000D68EF13|nr:hypothetical protein [Aquimarina sp. AU119]
MLKRYLLMNIATFLLLSCSNVNQEEKIQSIQGNWYSTKNNFYEEYYFDKQNNMYSYDPYSENISHFQYIITKDSLFRCFVHPDLNNEYVFYDKILYLDSTLIKFNKIRLTRLLNTEIGLDSYIQGEINRREFLIKSLKREKKEINNNPRSR